MRLARDWSPAGLPCTRTAWSELWELTQARGCWLRNAETTFRVQRDLVEALNQVQV
jgi:spectrin beta